LFGRSKSTAEALERMLEMMRRGDPYWITENVKNVFNIGFQCYWVRFPEGQREKRSEVQSREFGRESQGSSLSKY